MARKQVLLPDWLLGSRSRRLLLFHLANPPEDGWTVTALADEVGIGRAWAHEALGWLRALDLLDPAARGPVLRRSGGLGGIAAPLNDLIERLNDPRTVPERAL